jgi:hypothetical protein
MQTSLADRRRREGCKDVVEDLTSTNGASSAHVDGV